MNKFTAKNTILPAAILLIIGIIATQAFAHMGGNFGGGWFGMMGRSHMGNGYMMSNFSVEDQQKMQDRMNTFFSETADIREQIYRKQLELEQEYAATEMDQAKIEEIQKQLFDLNTRFEKERFNHMTAMQQLFPDQGRSGFYGRGNRYGNCF